MPVKIYASVNRLPFKNHAIVSRTSRPLLLSAHKLHPTNCTVRCSREPLPVNFSCELAECDPNRGEVLEINGFTIDRYQRTKFETMSNVRLLPLIKVFNFHFDIFGYSLGNI